MMKKKLVIFLCTAFILLSAMGCGISNNTAVVPNVTDDEVVEETDIIEEKDLDDGVDNVFDNSSWESMSFFDFYNIYMYTRVGLGDTTTYLVQMEKTPRINSATGRVQDVKYNAALGPEGKEHKLEVFLAVNSYHQDNEIYLENYGVYLDSYSDLSEVPEKLKNLIICSLGKATTRHLNIDIDFWGLENQVISNVEKITVNGKETVRFDGSFTILDYYLENEENPNQEAVFVGYLTTLKNGDPIWTVACDTSADLHHTKELDDYAYRCISSLYEPTAEQEDEMNGHVFR